MGTFDLPRRLAVLQWALRALWSAVVPALMAGVTLRYGLPSRGSDGVVAFVALFFLFAALIHYWRFHIPGGRHASHLPATVVPSETNADALVQWNEHAALYAWIASPRIDRRYVAACDPVAREAIRAATAHLRATLDGEDADAAGRAAQNLRSVAAKALSSKKRNDAIAPFSSVAVAAAAATILRSYVIESYVVLGGSMLPTLEPGDRIAGNRWTPERVTPRRADVVVFRSRSVSLGAAAGSVPELLVKRVIGLPGDRITMRAGVPVINDWPVPSCDAGVYSYVPHDGEAAVRGKLRVEYLDDSAYLTLNALSLPFDDVYVVEPGEVFVLGDNRSNSLDSRAWNGGHGGGVPGRAIEARGQWFLVGSHRSGATDFGRFLSSIDTLERALHVESIDTRAVDEGIRRCLSTRPQRTRPPPPSPERVSHASPADGQ